MKIGLKIKELRQQAGISQETLAQALCVSPQAVSRWETGATAPDIALLPPIAYYFHVTIDALFSYDNPAADAELDQFFDEYYAAMQTSADRAQDLLREALRRFPGQESLRLLQCFHLRAPEDYPAKIGLCQELMRSSNPTVRTEAIIVLASTYHKLGKAEQARDTLSLLPECDTTKLSLSAMFFEGSEAMLCAQRQKSSSLAMLFDMMLRISELYRLNGNQSYAEKTKRTASLLLQALKEDAPYRFPKGDRPDSTWERFSIQYGSRI